MIIPIGKKVFVYVQSVKKTDIKILLFGAAFYNILTHF